MPSKPFEFNLLTGVFGLQQGLAYTSTPLTAEQSAALVPILAQYAKPAMQPSNPFAVLNSDLGVVRLGEQGVSQLQGVLSAPQVQALNTEIAAQQQLFQARRQTAH